MSKQRLMGELFEISLTDVFIFIILLAVASYAEIPHFIIKVSMKQKFYCDVYLSEADSRTRKM